MADGGGLAGRRWLYACGGLLVGAGIVAILWATLGSSGSSNRGLVAGTLAGLEQPAPGEFPTPSSAIDYLVEQVQAQDVDAATKVIASTSVYPQETFQWTVQRLQSVTLSGAFPGQPYSRLYALVAGPINFDFTLFGVALLDPQLESSQVSVVTTPQEQKALRARLDPSRLSGIFVKSINVHVMTGAAKYLGTLPKIGVTEIADATAVIGGIGTPQSFEVVLYRVGNNWLIDSIGPS